MLLAGAKLQKKTFFIKVLAKKFSVSCEKWYTSRKLYVFAHTILFSSTLT